MAITRQRIRVYMNLDVDVNTDTGLGTKQSEINNEIRTNAQEALREMLNDKNPEFHSIRLVRSK
jgi:hypothetical protein